MQVGDGQRQIRVAVRSAIVGVIISINVRFDVVGTNSGGQTVRVNCSARIGFIAIFKAAAVHILTQQCDHGGGYDRF
ncbi:hypothetical protein SDC9_187253 [bioreactor metagenome]|uniref:Uncharacterized protein n=1 Tax=bioreactor metagenome TaxID=1076179 RepID=A0A645HU97_9ZZZZ